MSCKLAKVFPDSIGWWRLLQSYCCWKELLLTTITALWCYYCAKSRESRNITLSYEMLGPSSSSRMIVQELTVVDFFDIDHLGTCDMCLVWLPLPMNVRVILESFLSQVIILGCILFLILPHYELCSDVYVCVQGKVMQKYNAFQHIATKERSTCFCNERKWVRYYRYARWAFVRHLHLIYWELTKSLSAQGAFYLNSRSCQCK